MRLETGELKFPIFAQLIKAALPVNHGSVDVERDFSLSHQILSKDRTLMKNIILNANLTVYVMPCNVTKENLKMCLLHQSC